MTGWEKVIAATVLALIGLVGVNLAIWRRMREVAKAGRGSVGQVEDQPERIVEATEVGDAQPSDAGADPVPANGAEPIGHRLRDDLEPVGRAGLDRHAI